MTLAIDGIGVQQSSTTCLLTTAAAGDIICFFQELNGGGGTTAVSSPTLGAFNFRAVSDPGANTQEISFWWAYASVALTNELISCTQSGGTFGTCIAFGVSSTVGFNHTNPFDPNVSLPATSPATGVNPVLSTTTANSFIFYGSRTVFSTVTGRSGFTTVVNSNFLISEYFIASSAQTLLTVGCNNPSDQNGGIGDALIESGSPPPISYFTFVPAII